jgi:hypothetical protein
VKNINVIYLLAIMCMLIGAGFCAEHAFYANATRQALVTLKPEGSDRERLESDLEHHYNSIGVGVGLIAGQIGILIYARRLQQEKRVA